MTRTHVILFAVATPLALYVGLRGLFDPLANWDMIGYVAAALAQSGLTGADLHDATYGDIRQILTEERFYTYTQRYPYVRGVFTDPAALEQQLPFYSIRAGYVTLLRGIAQIGGSLGQATYVVSALSGAALCYLVAAMLATRTTPRHWIFPAIALVIALFFSDLDRLARYSTPDALFALVALGILALFYRARDAALTLLVLLPLIRTDAVLLSALLLVLLLAERDRTRRHYAAIALSGVVYLGLNVWYGNYGHLVLFNFTLIPGMRSPYPATLEISGNLADYLAVYGRAIPDLFTHWPPYVALTAAGAVIVDMRQRGRLGPQARLALVAIAYMALHFLILPLGATRHYGLSLLFCGIYIAQVAATPRADTNG